MENTTKTTVGYNSDAGACRCSLLGNDVQKRHIKCPYLYAQTDMMGKCQISGGTTQSGYHFERFCLSATAWQNCLNYQGREKSMYS